MRYKNRVTGVIISVADSLQMPPEWVREGATAPSPSAPAAPTKADMMAALDEQGVEYAKSATKADLQALLDAAPDPVADEAAE